MHEPSFPPRGSFRHGYERLQGPERGDEAVAWWYWAEGPARFRFARGGRVRTCRDARAAIRDAEHEHAHELRSWEQRPTHRLAADGALIPLEPAHA